MDIPFKRLLRTRREAGPGRRLVRAILMLTCLLTLTMQVASAHGQDRTLQLSNVTAGPFRATVWTAPGLLRTGEIHVETAVIGADGAPRRDVLVQVDVSSLGGGAETLTATAYPAVETNGVTQEAVFMLRQAGNYEVNVILLGADGARGRITFPMEVVCIARTIRFGIHSLMIASILTSVWMLREGFKIWFGRWSTGPTMENNARRTTR